ncbi:MAG TPA: purine-nucleoside phosphorylase [Acidobacteriaceae bacterium]|nr:purine-nucleoside phosphorylase [Acidobacteriaceae bacterium]
MGNEAFENAEQAARVIQEQIAVTPTVAVILGSGLGSFAETVEQPVSIPYASIPHFPRSTVEGHNGRLVVGTLAGTHVAVMQGRVHGYEGYTPQEIAFPVRVLGALAIKTIVVTNAAGGIRLGLRQGQLVLISDHINFTGQNPAAGPNDVRWGSRFFDMTDAYAKRLRLLARAIGRSQGVEFAEGVYLGVPGPSFETPAEIKAFRILGADLVGMSTVHEVIAARHMGMEVLGISCVTNLAAGILDQPLDHREVVETGARAQGQLTRLLTALIPRMNEGA